MIYVKLTIAGCSVYSTLKTLVTMDWFFVVYRVPQNRYNLWFISAYQYISQYIMTTWNLLLSKVHKVSHQTISMSLLSIKFVMLLSKVSVNSCVISMVTASLYLFGDARVSTISFWDILCPNWECWRKEAC